MPLATAPQAAKRMVDALLVAAEEREFDGLLRRVTAKRRAAWPLACAWDVTTTHGEWTLIADGAGARLAGFATRQALERVRPRAVASTGLCGALREGLHAGDVVWVRELVCDDGRALACTLPEGVNGVRLLSSGRVAVSAEDKRALQARTGADVVEMEAAGVAEAARAADLPFYCVRVVSDTVDDSLPLDFNAYRDSEGRFSRSRVAAACLMRPWVIPALLRFDRQCRMAAASLGDYLVDLRFA